MKKASQEKPGMIHVYLNSKNMQTWLAIKQSLEVSNSDIVSFLLAAAGDSVLEIVKKMEDFEK